MQWGKYNSLIISTFIFFLFGDCLEGLMSLGSSQLSFPRNLQQLELNIWFQVQHLLFSFQINTDVQEVLISQMKEAKFKIQAERRMKMHTINLAFKPSLKVVSCQPGDMEAWRYIWSPDISGYFFLDMIRPKHLDSLLTLSKGFFSSNVGNGKDN